MRIRAVATSLLVAGLPPVAAGPVAPVTGGGPLQLAVVKVVECDRDQHLGTFYGRMRRVPGADRMWMRFTLLQRTGGAEWRAVRAPALARWRKSRHGVRAFGFRQRVLGLSEGAAYRARVEFRWYDGDGRLIRRARRRSSVCSELGPQPNLRVPWIGLERRDDLPPATARYRVAVENSGSAPASPVAVSLSVDGRTAGTATLSRLPAGGLQVVSFTGPACQRPDSPVRAVVDPADSIGESAEYDNVTWLRCADLLE